ncbi:hypothetical protein P9112_013211 [Eukaryota sp. TZLM1-RC]
MFQIPDHAYLSPQHGGLGWTKASILTSCAFVGGCRNAIFEFSERFADWEDLLMTTQSSTFCCKKLQQKLSKIFESLDFDVRLGLAKKKNPAFANLLQDMCDSTSSALVTTIPQVYGTLLSDSAWTLNMRFRSFIWPDNLPHNLICKCSREIVKCFKFQIMLTLVHNMVV